MSRLIDRLMADLGVTHEQIAADLAERGITREWLRETGIIPLVAWARGYSVYRTEERTVRDRRGRQKRRRFLIDQDRAIFDADYRTLPQPQRACMARWANQCDGRRRPHHYLPEMEAALRRLHGNPHIYTQIRPDKRVKTGDHSDHLPHDPWTWRYHLVLNEHHGHRKVLTKDQGGMSREDIDQLSVERIIEIAEERRGQPGWLPWNRWHREIDLSRFLNVPGPCIDAQPHNHAISYRGKSEWLAQHLRAEHPDGADPDGLHDREWTDPRTGKQKRKRIKDKSYELAKRIDTNPLVTAAMLLNAQILFYLIEGGQKADAVLSWLLLNDGLFCGLPAAVMSAPAINQWDARELPEFICPYGADKLVLVGADSDAYENPQVMQSANDCCSRCVELGAAEAYVFLPPESRGPGVKRGWDDALGKDGCSLEDGEFQHRDILAWDEVYTVQFAAHPSFTGSGRKPVYRPGRNNMTSIAASYMRDQDERGVFEVPQQRTQAKRLPRKDHKDAGLATKRIFLFGYADVVAGSLETLPDPYSHGDIYPERPRGQFIEQLRPRRIWREPARDFFTRWHNERGGMVATADDVAQIKLRQRMDGEVLDGVRQGVDHILSILLAFRAGETSADEWARHLDNPDREETG